MMKYFGDKDLAHKPAYVDGSCPGDAVDFALELV